MLVSGVFGLASGLAVTCFLRSGDDDMDCAYVTGLGRLPFLAIGVVWPGFSSL